MTTLGAWISYPKAGRRATALYVVSDSRITWGSQNRRWDAGRKLFAAYEKPHILGYCGDVVFPSLVLAQIVSAIDQNILFPVDASPAIKHQIIFDSLKTSWSGRRNCPNVSFQVVHAMRTNVWPEPSFELWQIDYNAVNRSWNSAEVSVGPTTGLLIALGSGQRPARSHSRRWSRSDVSGTSRSIFSAFFDAITSGDDPLTGGPPQIAALYSSLSPRTIGFALEGKHYLHGLEVLPGESLSNIEWRDPLFQRIDPATFKVVSEARRYARPKGL